MRFRYYKGEAVVLLVSGRVKSAVCCGDNPQGGWDFRLQNGALVRVRRFWKIRADRRPRCLTT